MSGTRNLIAAVIFWAAVLLALFGAISAVMSLAMFEGEERLWGAFQWAAFALGVYVLGRIARHLLRR